MRPLRSSDARLVRRAIKGDEQAFAEIFEQHGQDIYRYCRAILGNPDDAQDALQNTMARVLRALPGEERTIHLRPWLYRVARNESLTLIRDRLQTAELTEANEPMEPGTDIRAEHRHAVRTLVKDLASLPETQRSALVLHELSGLSHEEISQALQRSPRASRQAIYEARLALADLQEGRDMHCDDVRAAISDGDGRVARGRKIRSHLRECQRCSDFALAIDHRRAQFGMLAPPLPAAAAAGLIASALGGGTAASGLAGAGAVGVAGGSVAAKSAGVIAASLAIGAGGASLAGVDLPGGGGSDKREAVEQRSGAGSVPRDEFVPAGIGTRLGTDTEEIAASAVGPRAQSNKPNADGRASGKPNEKSETTKEPEKSPTEPPAHSNAGGATSSPSGPPSNSNAGGNSSTSGEPPAHSTSGGDSSGAAIEPSANSNAGGNGSSGSPPAAPPAHSTAGGKPDK